MDTSNSHNHADTSVQFENRQNWGKAALTGLAGFVLAAGLLGGYSFFSGGVGNATLSAETTTSTAGVDGPATDDSADWEASPFPIDLSDNDVAVPDEELETAEPVASTTTVPPAHQLAPAELWVQTTVDMGFKENNLISIKNTGQETLTINSMTGPAFVVNFGELPTTLVGGNVANVEFSVDHDKLPFGPFELEIEVDSSGGSEIVSVVGSRPFILVPPANIDVQDQTVVPHLQPIAPIKITNYEDYNVDITLESLNPRLSVPASYTLVPGVNVIAATVVPYGVNPATSMLLDFKVNWIGGSETASVLKFGK